MGRKKKQSPPPAFATDGSWHTHHVILFDDLLNSPAYIALSAHAKEAYTILMQEYKGPYTGPKVICPYSTFQKKGMRSNTLSRALLELETFGLVRIDHGGLEHTPNVYHLVGDWKKIRTEEELKKAKESFREELDRRKRAKEQLARETPGYGIDIRSNESVGKGGEKADEITNETDSNLTEKTRDQETEAFLAQVQKALVGNEITGTVH